MKYKCGMIKDLMPLCVDDEASESSKKAVIEHLVECKQCESYYESLSKEITNDNKSMETRDGFAELAAKLRKRKLITRITITIVFFVVFELMLNFSSGYRFKPENAANESGRLNYTSKLLTSYDWGDWQFYIYDSQTCYDVVTIQKTWHGWKSNENCLIWPKVYTNNEIEVAGALYFWSDTNDKFGIQIFPMIVNDNNVASIEVTVFGETKKIDTTTNKIVMMTFENSDSSIGSEATGFAYDRQGNAVYTLQKLEELAKWVWLPIEE